MIDIRSSFWPTLDFIGGSDFSGTGQGEVRVTRDSFTDPHAVVHVDLDGDGATDGRIDLTLASINGAPNADDFIL